MEISDGVTKPVKSFPLITEMSCRLFELKTTLNEEILLLQQERDYEDKSVNKNLL